MEGWLSMGERGEDGRVMGAGLRTVVSSSPGREGEGCVCVRV